MRNRSFYKQSGFKRISGARAGTVAVKVYQCRGCETQFRPGEKPDQCYTCGRMDYYCHDSRAEAARWATLRLLEGKGKIQNLQRQVKMPLMAASVVGGKTVAVKVGYYIADFVYLRDGEEIIEDVKGGMTDVASLKLRWMNAMGKPVKLST